jgi:hypothetical protein
MAEATLHYIKTMTRQQEADLLLADFPTVAAGGPEHDQPPDRIPRPF